VGAPDVIERELILPVSRERVWAALTQPHALTAWFGSTATVDLRPGGALSFAFGGDFATTGVIEVVEPLRRFAFRWRPFDGQHAVAAADGPTTRVEFTLADHPDGTHLRLVESGFASLPDAFGGAHERNTRGWRIELGELSAYFASATAVVDPC
jgi:uncharacterized protein YndB with AHSA1/START domain